MSCGGIACKQAQRVQSNSMGYSLGAQLSSKYILYCYLDPLGRVFLKRKTGSLMAGAHTGRTYEIKIGYLDGSRQPPLQGGPGNCLLKCQKRTLSRLVRMSMDDASMRIDRARSARTRPFPLNPETLNGFGA